MSTSHETRVVDARFVAGAVDTESLPAPTHLEIAFAGRSNVGKSSLMNALLQRHNLVRTSRTPGCTRQLNVFDVRCSDGLELSFVDLPGYGWARRSMAERKTWQAMIEGYLQRRVGLKAVVMLVDVRRGVEEEERELVEFLRAGRPVEVVLVATKIDKVGAAGRKPAIEAVRKGAAASWGKDGAGGLRPLPFSAVSGEGREELWTRIRAALAAEGRLG
jgi:GTP-binding protein